MNKIKSLKKEILQLLVLFSISVIIIVGILTIWKLYNSKIEIIKHNQNLVLKQVGTEVEQLLQEIEDISLYISENYSYNYLVLKNIVETNKSVSSILILDKNGIIEDFYAISNLNIYKGFDYSNKNYFKKIKDYKKYYWSNVFLSSVDEEPTISYSFKMEDKIGVIMIKLTELSNFIQRFKNTDDSHMLRIFDETGIMILNPDAKQFVLQRFNASSLSVFIDLINKEKPFTQAIFTGFTKKGKQLGAYVKVKKTGWSILVRQSHDDILKSLTSIIISIVLVVLFFSIIAIFLSIKISKKIFKAFDNMQSITSQIANGHYNVKVDQLHYEELNNLLESFNKMQVEIDKREDNLEKSLNSFKGLFNSTMESIVLSKDGIIIDINNVSMKLFQASSKKDFINKPMFDFIDENYHNIVKSNLIKNTEPYEVELVKLNGKRFQALVQGKILEFEGEDIRLTAVIDITELKQKDQLLFQQSKMASMGEMIGNIAHQWRQPLNTISTCASGIKFEKEFGVLDNDRVADTMDIIVENTQFLSKTIDDFRNFFKSDKKTEKFVTKIVIKRALKLLDASLKNYEIELFENYLEEELFYEGLANEFIQVFVNIINNSKDAFVANNVENRVIYIDERIESKNYILEIKDNAGGIPNNIIDKVFEPYFTTKHKAQGTGIGLYMSHQIIVDHMHGNITAKNISVNYDNTHYSGACFKISLPLNSKT
ncbi:MAG: PAS domain-containing protein [Campylobacteraceae bacterium]|nr:PAS domain-containing protein [Campylobacteraceae bacterium]